MSQDDDPWAEALELAAAPLRARDPAAAAAILDRALAACEARVGPARHASRTNNAGILFLDAGFPVRAEATFGRALGLMEAHHGEDHPEVARVLCNLARARRAQGLAGDHVFYQRALRILEGNPGRQHPDFATALEVGAELEGPTSSRGLELLGEALHVLEGAVGVHHPEYARVLAILASRMYDAHRQVEAGPLYARLLEVHEARYGAAAPELVWILSNLGLAFGRLGGDPSRAVAAFERGLCILRDLPPGTPLEIDPDLPGVVETFVRISRGHVASGDRARLAGLVREVRARGR